MKIGIDIDNTITNTLPVLRRYCIKYNDNVVKRNLKINEEGFATHNFFEWTYEEEMEFSNKYLKKAVNSATIKVNCLNVINKLKEKGHEIHIITARSKPQFKDSYTFTFNFLARNNIPYDKLIVECIEKEHYCLENDIEIMLEDEPENVSRISKHIPVLCINGPQNENLLDESLAF